MKRTNREKTGKTPNAFAAEMGKGPYNHRFGGTSWIATGPLDALAGPPVLLFVLDLSDPRLEWVSLQTKTPELPFFTYINLVMEYQPRYLFFPENRTATFMEGDGQNTPFPEFARLPNPLPERSLILRPLTAEEEADVSTIVGGVGSKAFIRIGGDPPWLQEPEIVKSRRRKRMKFVAAVGYEGPSAPPIISRSRSFMIGELALYFFLDAEKLEVAVTSQST